MNGSYQIRAYGIDQLDQNAFAGQPGDRQFRGGVDTKGQFALNDKWTWGWDGVLLTDYYFMSDYRLAPVQGSAGIVPQPADGSDLAALSDRRRQSQLLRRAHDLLPQLLRKPEPGSGHLSGHRLFQRDQPARSSAAKSATRPTSPTCRATTRPSIRSRRWRNTASLCTTTSADPLARTPSQCLLRGLPGTYTRADGARRNGGGRSPIPTVRSGRRLRSCAPTPSIPRFRTSRASRISCRSATPRRCA